MRTAALVLALGVFGALADGAAEGRRGNEALRADDAPAAEAAYVDGLAQDDVPPEVGAALWNNLGLARFAQDRVADADSAFARVPALESDPVRRARTAYNRGAAALAGGDLETAISANRRALVLDPTYVPAQVNLEIALRRQRDQDDHDSPDTPEPSPFAQRLKAQADSLVEARQYDEALGLLQDGLARDSSVQAFGDYLQRLGQIVQIDSDSLLTP